MEHDRILQSDDRIENGQDHESIFVLPDELILHILQFLGLKDVLNLTSCLNKKFYELSKDPLLIPKSFSLKLFRSPNHERNTLCREQMPEITARACLMNTLSIEVNHNCNLNEELQLIGNGRCKVIMQRINE